MATNKTTDCDRCNRTVSKSSLVIGSRGYKYLCKPCDNALNPNMKGIAKEIKNSTKNIEYLEILGD